MATEFKLPDPGEGIHEAEVVEILVKEGDRVEEEQSVLVVETDKAANEIPSPVDGVVKRIHVSTGEMVKVGDVLMEFDAQGTSDAPEPEEGEAPAQSKESGREKDGESGKEKAGQEKAPPEKGKRSDQDEQGGERAKTGAKDEKGPVPATPATRRLARELGVDLHDVSPSGPAGRVTAEDVTAHAEQRKDETGAPDREKAQSPAKAPVSELPDFSRWGEVEHKPLRSIRRTIAKRMALSWERIPHVTHQDRADITDLEAFRQKHRGEVEEAGGALTLTVFAMKASVAALKAYPRFNASIDMAAEEIIYKRHYHIGVAVDTERGLIVPVIRDVDRKSMIELAVELTDLAERTRNGKVEAREMSGGTFTITNVGPLGGTGFTPIINYPQAAILGLARARLEAVVRESSGRERFEARRVLPISLGFDHRLVDGAEGARFAGKIIASLEDPATLMMAM